MILFKGHMWWLKKSSMGCEPKKKCLGTQVLIFHSIIVEYLMPFYHAQDILMVSIFNTNAKYTLHRMHVVDFRCCSEWLSSRTWLN